MSATRYEPLSQAEDTTVIGNHAAASASYAAANPSYYPMKGADSSSSDDEYDGEEAKNITAAFDEEVESYMSQAAKDTVRFHDTLSCCALFAKPRTAT
jgi:hypothetical protein